MGGPTSANARTDSPESARGILAAFERPAIFPPAHRVEILDNAGGSLARVPKTPKLPHDEAIFGAALGKVALAIDQRGDGGFDVVLRCCLRSRGARPLLGVGEMTKSLPIGIPRCLASSSETGCSGRIFEGCPCGCSVDAGGSSRVGSAMIIPPWLGARSDAGGSSGTGDLSPLPLRIMNSLARSAARFDCSGVMIRPGGSGCAFQGIVSTDFRGS